MPRANADRAPTAGVEATLSRLEARALECKVWSGVLREMRRFFVDRRAHDADHV
jgi:hypothetical protein